MKIAVLTYPLNNNFGNLLQAWALKNFLIGYDHDVTVFYRKHRLSYRQYLQNYIKSMGLKILKKPTYPQNSPLQELRFSRNTIRFIQEEIKAQEMYSTTTLYNNLKKFDVIIVGSDQVWRPKFLGNLYRDYFLVNYNKPPLQKILSYAASFGSDIWEFNQKEEVDAQNGLTRFDAISVRELNAINFLKKHFSLESEVMPDPTLLLNSSTYETLVKDWIKNTNAFKADIFCYLLDLTIQERILLKSYAQKQGLSISFIQDSYKDKNGESVYPDVREWLSWIKNSALIITDSFHGSVFSLIFEKRFIPIINNKRGNSRIESLLQMFGIDSQMTTIENLVRQRTIHSVNIIHNSEFDNKKSHAKDFILQYLNKKI